MSGSVKLSHMKASDPPNPSQHLDLAVCPDDQNPKPQPHPKHAVPIPPSSANPRKLPGFGVIVKGDSGHTTENEAKSQAKSAVLHATEWCTIAVTQSHDENTIKIA